MQRPGYRHGIEEWYFGHKASTRAYLYDEGASGWKEQTSPSSISSFPPRAVAGSHEVYRAWWPAVLTESSQTTPAAETRTVRRSPPQNPHRRRIWIRGPSCWTRCLTVSSSTWQVLSKTRWEREREKAWTQVSHHSGPSLQLYVQLHVPLRPAGECDQITKWQQLKCDSPFKVWFYSPAAALYHSSCIVPQLRHHKWKHQLWKAKAEPKAEPFPFPPHPETRLG